MKRFLLFALVMSLALTAGCNKVEDAFEIETETMTVAKEMTDEYIIERFYAAEDFWLSWVYGQYYVTDRTGEEYYETVNEESPIQTKKELKEAFEKHFSKELTGEFMSFLNPEDIDGKLYISYGDVGDNGEGLDKITVKKLDDNKYELTLDMTQYFTDEKFSRKVFYVFEDGKWVFENDKDNKFFFHWE